MTDFETTNCEENKSLLEAGDVFFFAGRDKISRGIQIATLSRWSHVGVIGEITPMDCLVAMKSDAPIRECLIPNESTKFRRTLLFESTILSTMYCSLAGAPVAGVQCHSPANRVIGYPGEVFLMRLRPEWRLCDQEKHRLAATLLRPLGTPYDGLGAVQSGSRLVRLLRWIGLLTPADMSTLFCSEYVADALKSARRVCLAINPSAWTPRNLFYNLLHSGVYDPHVRRIWPTEKDGAQ